MHHFLIGYSQAPRRLSPSSSCRQPSFTTALGTTSKLPPLITIQNNNNTQEDGDDDQWGPGDVKRLQARLSNMERRTEKELEHIKRSTQDQSVYLHHVRSCLPVPYIFRRVALYWARERLRPAMGRWKAATSLEREVGPVVGGSRSIMVVTEFVMQSRLMVAGSRIVPC